MLHLAIAVGQIDPKLILILYFLLIDYVLELFVIPIPIKVVKIQQGYLSTQSRENISCPLTAGHLHPYDARNILENV